MVSIDKRAIIDENRVLTYSIHDDFETMHTIREDIRGEEAKKYKLSMWEDYNFTAWTNGSMAQIEKTKYISFDFDPTHPLYEPLLRLLNGEDYIVIDDEYSYELNQKLLLIKKDKDGISLNFINNFDDDDLLNKFSIVIRCIGRDPKSKIPANSNLKDRLKAFFKEVRGLVDGEYLQVSVTDPTRVKELGEISRTRKNDK